MAGSSATPGYSSEDERGRGLLGVSIAADGNVTPVMLSRPLPAPTADGSADGVDAPGGVQHYPAGLMWVEAAARTGVLPRVWIVDDSPLEAELVRRTLAPLYQVDVFTDGAAVIEQFASAAPPDAVILDWQMPGISGLEVCSFLRSRTATRSIPILMLTVQHDTHDLVQCLAAGADDFLSKPCNAAELSARIAALVRTKQMHERVQAAEQAVRSLLMQLPDAVMGVDGAGMVTFVNMEAERMLAKEPAALLGHSIAEILPLLSLDQRLPEGLSALKLPDLLLGDRVLAPALRRHAGVDVTELTLSFRDVTLERRHQEERSRLLAAESAARAQAEQASRAKDEFLAVVSHELRTPLNAILGWTRILRSGIQAEEKRARALETIERNAIAQQKLIEDILDVSRIISGKLQIDRALVDLGAVVRVAVDAIRLAADARSIAVGVDIGGAPPSIVGDADRLQQIVWNLLSNAVKFTTIGGAVSVQVGAEGDGAFIRVSDTGQGISAAFLPYIFDRFRQADTGTTRSHGGLGLGLAIVRHLAEMHGGSVQAESEPGKGSTFTVHLPRASPVERAASEPSAPTEPVTLRTAPPPGLLVGIRVLVVDDDPDARELVSAMLQGAGAEVRAVSSVREALGVVGALQPDAIVSDIGIPTEDGYALAKRLRELPADQGGQTPAIALTAFAAPRDRKLAIDAGFDGFLAKPVSAPELVTLVGQLVAQPVLG
jgi:signal transduction histidine kinase